MALGLALQWPEGGQDKRVNAGESVGPSWRPCRARFGAQGLGSSAAKRRSGTLTRKRSLVQIQYGPRDFSKSCLALRARMGASAPAVLS